MATRQPANYTSAECWDRYREARDAYVAVTTFATSYSLGDRSVTKADAPDIKAAMSYWIRQARALEAVESDSPASRPDVLVASFRNGPE